MNKEQVLDEYFLEARANLLEIAAFIDRLERNEGAHDFRSVGFIACLPILHDQAGEKTRRILEQLSDPTMTPVEQTSGKGAAGAWPNINSFMP